MSYLRTATLSILFLFPLLTHAQNTVLLDLTTDDYPEETSWELLNDQQTQVASQGGYATTGVQATVTIPDLPNGAYTFKIYDTAGDGLCCGYGIGQYTLTESGTALVIASGAEFDDQEATSFVLPFVPPVPGCTDPDALNYDANAELDDGTCIYSMSGPMVVLEEVAIGFNSPVDISNAGDDRLFITERGGVIRILNPDLSTNATPFLDISSLTNGGGEQGLLGLAFHPNYPDSGYFYVNYTKLNGDSRISRFTVSADPDVADPGSELTLLEQVQPYSNHNAGDLDFGPDGMLYIPFGDGGSGGDPQNYGQNNMTLLGKMLRIDVNNGLPYSIPPDNPFIGDPNTLDEIWATGLRNTWRFSFDANTGDMWMGDVGQNTWEEIDFQPANSTGGENYGWRCYEGLHEYNTSGCEAMNQYDSPVFEYGNGVNGACSVTGGYVYRGSEYPSLQGGYIFTDYCNGLFSMLFPNGSGWDNYDVTDNLGFGWSTFGESSDLELYVANLDGSIHRITGPCDALEVQISLNGDTLEAPVADAYIWLLDGEPISGATDQTFVPSQSGEYSVGISLDGCSGISDVVVVTGVETYHAVTRPLNIYPDPTSDLITIKVAGVLSSEYDMKIISSNGSIVGLPDNSLINSGSEFKISLKDLPTGIYHVLISDRGLIYTGKVSVIK